MNILDLIKKINKFITPPDLYVPTRPRKGASKDELEYVRQLNLESIRSVKDFWYKQIPFNK